MGQCIWSKLVGKLAFYKRYLLFCTCLSKHTTWEKTNIEHHLLLMEELHILLTPNKEHKKVFLDVRAKLPEIEESGKFEIYG